MQLSTPEKNRGRPGVKVYNLQTLCVEVGDQLIFTTRQELNTAINQIRTEVFSAYVCDRVFVAEMPGSKGVLLKIGHFDEIISVTHVER